MSCKNAVNAIDENDLKEKLYQEVEGLLKTCSTARTNLKTDFTKQVPTLTSVQEEEDSIITKQLKETWTLFAERHQISSRNDVSVNNNVQTRNGNKNKVETNPQNDMNSRDDFALNNLEDLFLKAFIWPLRITIILLKGFSISILFFIIFYCFMTLHKPTQLLISRNTQDLIYPFMRTLRLLTLPVVKKFPILTDYYEEYCLVSNPFYEVEEVDCWSCVNVRHVVDLTGLSNFSSSYQDSGTPFLVKDAVFHEFRLEDIRNIFMNNQDLLKNVFVKTNYERLTTLKKVISPQHSETLNAKDFHLKWYINRVTIARLWRSYFPKPYFVPLSREISVEHYLFLDRPESPTNRLPVTEFANVFLIQASGNRSIVLIPTEQCQSQCKVVSVVLQPKDVLFYNWMFWSPLSIAADSSSFQTSISFMGSFY